MTGPRRLAVGLWLAALALAAWAISQARFATDLSMFLPQAPTEEQRLLVEQLRDGALTRVALIGIEGADAATRARISAAMRARLASDALFATVANGQGGGFERERDLLLAHRYALSPNVNAARFSEEGLRAAVSDTVDLLASPAGLLVKALVPRDPTGELLAVIERLQPDGGPRLVNGAWASPDGSRALLVARTRASGSDIDAQARAAAAIEAAFAAAKEEIGPRAIGAAAPPGATSGLPPPGATSGLPAAGATLVTTGPAIFSVRSRALIKHDVERLALASLALVAGLLLAAYRSPLALVLGLVPVASGAIAGVAAVSLGFGVVHGVTLGFGTALIGEAIDYSIYLFVQSERSRAAGDAQWVAGFWPTIRLGVLTSIAGFSALLFSGLPGLAQLGLYSIAGLVAAAAVTRFVLPALLPRGLRIHDLGAMGERLHALAARVARARPLAAAVALAALAVLAANHERLWDLEAASLNPISARDRALDAAMRADLGAADARVTVAVRGASLDAALAEAERAGARLDALVASGSLAGYESPAKVLPSASTQRARLASLPPAAELRARLVRALAGSPLAATKLEPFIADAERARGEAPLAPDALAGTALEAALDGMAFRDSSGRWTALVGLRPAGAQPIDVDAVRAALAGTPALVVDLKAEVDRLYSGYFRRALATSAIGLGVIVALLLATLRDARRTARVLAPLAVSVLAVAAWHAAGGTRMSLLHLVGLLLVVAIGSNYALFFDRIAGPRDPLAARTLASIALANATTVASFGMLALSDVPVLKAIGSTVALGTFLALALAAMLHRPGFTMPQGQDHDADDHRYRA